MPSPKVLCTLRLWRGLRKLQAIAGLLAKGYCNNDAEYLLITHIRAKVHMQNPHPSSSSSQLQVQSWSVPNQASHPHTFFNNSGTIQEQPDQPAASNSHYYRQKAIPSQAVNMNRTEYQAAVQRQARQSAPLQQVTIPTAPVNVHHPPAPQARKKTMLPQPSQSSVQQRSVPPKSHTVAPTAAAGSVRSTEHGRKSMFVHSTVKFTG